MTHKLNMKRQVCLRKLMQTELIAILLYILYPTIQLSIVLHSLQLLYTIKVQCRGHVHANLFKNSYFSPLIGKDT